MAPVLPDNVSSLTFAEPWQVQAFATAVLLSRVGLFTWPEWVSVFTAEITHSPQLPTEDSETAYFRQWLAALEHILTARGVATSEDIRATAEHWRRSYLHTPHGEPVFLRRDLSDVAEGADEEHDHYHTRSS